MLILITDIFYRKTFDIISIIKKQYPSKEILLGLQKKSDNFLVKLIYGRCKTSIVCTEKKEFFFNDLTRISLLYHNEKIIYVPVEEQTTKWFIEYAESNGKMNFLFTLPDLYTYSLLSDKSALNKFCLKNEIPAPKLFNIDELTDENYPILAKPCNGSGSRGLIRLYSSSDLTGLVRKQLQSEPYVIQELLPNGKDVKGAFFLCKNGKVLASYTHERIRTFPASGGVTVLSKLTRNEYILKEGAKLLDRINWNGLVMLEYLYDQKSDSYKVIEANPRLWGSIMLAEYGGAKILLNYIKLANGEECINPEYKDDRYIRWLLPDFISYIKSGFKIKGFWKKKNTCFINWSYANKISAVIFFLYSIFKPSNIKKLIQRLK